MKMFCLKLQGKIYKKEPFRPGFSGCRASRAISPASDIFLRPQTFSLCRIIINLALFLKADILRADGLSWFLSATD